MKEPRLSICIACRNRSRVADGSGIVMPLPSVAASVSVLSGKLDCELVVADFDSDDWPLQEWLPQAAGGAPVKIVQLGRRPLSRGLGLNRAAGEAAADRLLFTDTDIILCDELIADCLNLTATQALFPVCVGASGPGNRSFSFCHFGFGIAAMPRAVFDRSGGWPEFTSWGGEDTLMLYKLAGRAEVCRKAYARLVHIWHPPAGGRDDGRKEIRSDYNALLQSGAVSEADLHRALGRLIYLIEPRKERDFQVQSIILSAQAQSEVILRSVDTNRELKCRPQQGDLQEAFELLS